MLPQAGATEFIFLALIALIVVGPKDLPVLMRKVGQWVGKMRGLAAEFRSSFDELARQSELDELRKEVDALRSQRLSDPLNEMHRVGDEIHASLDPHKFIEEATSAAPAEPVVEPAAPGPAPKARSRAPRKAAAAEPPAKPPAAKSPAPKPKAKAKPAAKAAAPAKPRARRPAEAK